MMPSWINPVIDLIAIAIGVWLVLMQIKRNHKSNFELQTKQHQEELKLKLYDQLVHQIALAHHKIVQIHSEVSTLPFNINFFWKKKIEFNINPEPVKSRSIILIESNSIATNQVIELIAVLERYEIALPRFRTFIKVLAKQLEMIQKSFREFLDEATHFMPWDVEEEKAKKMGIPTTIIPNRPTEEQSKLLQKLATDCCDCYMQLTAFIYDLTIEAQNHILGELFNHKLPPREPKDENNLVVTFDSSNTKKIEEFLGSEEQNKKDV
jgi:hypothetical protein